MREFLMSPKVDFCFKELMRDSFVRQGFIAAILNVNPEEITDTKLLPTIQEKHREDEKISILDVRVELKDERQINMEMQVYPYKEWASRTLYYLSKMYVEQLKEGDSYSELKNCIHVGILDFVLFEDIKSFYSVYHIKEDITGTLYTDGFEFHILELPKLKEYDNPKSELLKWASFFNSKTKEEYAMSALDNIYIERAYENLQVMSMEEQKKLEYDARQKAIRDHISFVESAKKHGYEDGKKRGMEEGMKEGMEEGMKEGIK